MIFTGQASAACLVCSRSSWSTCQDINCFPFRQAQRSVALPSSSFIDRLFGSRSTQDQHQIHSSLLCETAIFLSHMVEIRNTKF